MIVIRIVTRADAIRLGLSRYLTGKPCKRGHIAERRTRQGDCTECAAAQVMPKPYPYNDPYNVRQCTP